MPVREQRVSTTWRTARAVQRRRWPSARERHVPWVGSASAVGDDCRARAGTVAAQSSFPAQGATARSLSLRQGRARAPANKLVHG